jgi:hypothetical protein
VSPPALPADVERFLVEHIDSIAQLEILHLVSASGATVYTAAAVARAIGVDVVWASTELQNLADRGLLQPNENGNAPSFRFAPRTPELAETVGRVLRAFQERRVTVIDLVANKPSRHIRGFADAFRLRKD